MRRQNSQVKTLDRILGAENSLLDLWKEKTKRNDEVKEIAYEIWSIN